jgi:hypothetical protein
MSMMLTEVARPAGLLRELLGPTSQPVVMPRRPRPAPANDGWADVAWLDTPREEDPSRPLAGDDVRLARASEPANDQVDSKGPDSGLLARLRRLMPHVDTAFVAVVLAAEFAVGSYCAAQAIESLVIAPTVAGQRALH